MSDDNSSFEIIPDLLPTIEDSFILEKKYSDVNDAWYYYIEEMLYLFDLGLLTLNDIPSEWFDFSDPLYGNGERNGTRMSYNDFVFNYNNNIKN